MTLLLDISAVPACHCNDALDDLFKAMAVDPAGGERLIWSLHDNPYLSEHVEDVTRRLQKIIEALQDAFAKAITGEPIGELQKADVPWLRWDEGRFRDVRAQLEAKRPAAYTLDDWMLLADYLIQRYLPDGVIQTEADYLTVRAVLLGKIQANMDASKRKLNAPTIGRLVELLPTRFAAVPPKVLSPIEIAVIEVAKARAAENISSVTESARHRMKTIIIEHVQAQMLGQREGQYKAMRQRLFDEFGQLNRDFRRIAVTEAGDACNQGFIAGRPIGSKVRRVEAYRGACEFCQSINGKVFTVVSPDKPDKNGQTEVWVGKDNIGRSASPRRKVGGQLMERGENERWWPAAGVQHPHCRGSWTVVVEKPANVSQEFHDWLEAKINSALTPGARSKS